MRKNIAARWVEALRSGEYKQTRGTLRDNKGFCCLGVLCNLHAQAHPKIAKRQTSKFEYLGDDAILPGAVMKWAGMSSSDGWIYDTETENGDEDTLASRNDCGATFKQIAELIEKQYKVL